MLTRCSWAEAQEMAKRAPQRGYMPPADAIEILLPDIAGTYADIQRYAVVPMQLRLDYLHARSVAFAYQADENREAAEALLDAVITAYVDATTCHGCRCECKDRYCADCVHDGIRSDADELAAFDAYHRTVAPK